MVVPRCWGLDLWLPLGLVALLLRRSRWLGVLAYILLCGLYVTMIYQESRTGFGNPSLWLDRNGRYATCVVILLALWRQYRPIVRSVVVPLPDQKRRLGLDVMRAIAVLCVVCAHFTPLVFAEWSANPALFRWTLYLGAVGVDIFFALSGYLIGGILLRTLTRIGEFAVVQRFWMRRWLRTLPAAYLSAIVVWFIAAPVIAPIILQVLCLWGALTPIIWPANIRFGGVWAPKSSLFVVPIIVIFFGKKTTGTTGIGNDPAVVCWCRHALSDWVTILVTPPSRR